MNRASVTTSVRMAMWWLCLLAAPSLWAAETPQLFIPLEQPVAARASDKAIQSHVVGMNPQLLLRRGTEVESTIRMALLPDLEFDATVESTEMQGLNRFVSRGRLPWVWNSSFLFHVDGPVVAGVIDVGQRRFRVTNLGDVTAGATALYQIDELNFDNQPSCGCEPQHVVDLAPVAASENRTATPDVGDRVDVMVVYTPSARTRAGGTANMVAQINLAISLTNQAYTDSGVNFRVRLVHQQEVTYNESSGFDAALSTLQATDGVIDDVHTLRNTYGADLVAMIINNNQYCGLGYLMATESASFANFAFSVTAVDCITNHTFAHEIGHNMGLMHDFANSANPGVKPYSYGHRFFGNTGTQWRTIMSYAPGTRINVHSNPGRNHDGIPTGTAVREDTVRSLNEVAVTVANWRQEITSGGTAPVINSSLTATGVVGTPFSYNITASNTPTSFGATGLPNGLTVSTTTGAISGTPTIAGVYDVTISATNASGTGSATLVLTITNPVLPPVINSPLTASGTVGTPFSYTITATNSPTSRNATSLPAGLGVNTTTGVISGTPTAAGVFNVTITAANTAGTDTQTLVITIGVPVLPPVITSPLTAGGEANVFFVYNIVATNGPTSYGASGLPSGLTISTSTGEISGTTGAGTSSVTITATNSAGTDTKSLLLTFTNAPPPQTPPSITSPQIAGGAVGTVFNYRITANNTPTSFGASGLPPGLSVNTATGQITGTPTTAGVFNATISATNAVGTGSRGLGITITGGTNPGGTPVITSPGTYNGVHQAFLSYQITATNNPTSYYATGLPAGVSVNPATGYISGTAIDYGVYYATVSATNSSGSGTKNLVLNIQYQEPCNCALTCVLDAATQFVNGSLPQVDLPWPARRLLSATRLFRDNVLKATPEGRALANAYYAHGCELATLVVFDPALLMETQRLLTELRPAMAAADVTGTAVVSAANWQRGWSLIDRLEQKASPALRADLDRLRTFLKDRQTVTAEGVVLQLKPATGPLLSHQSSEISTAPLAWLGGSVLLSLGLMLGVRSRRRSHQARNRR